VREWSRDQQNPRRVELLSWGELYDATRRSTWPQGFHFQIGTSSTLQFPKRVDCELVEVDVAPFEREEVPPAFAGKFLPWVVR